MINRILYCVGIALLSVNLAGCGLGVRESDNGNYSWARNVLPALYGRRAKGSEEVRAIADMATLVGRERTIQALMASTEFINHWSDTLIDILRVEREEDRGLQACAGSPLRTRHTDRLAKHIRDNPAVHIFPPPSDPAPGGPFNLADVLVSSLKLDDLSPFVRAYLFSMASKPLQGNQATESNIRDDLFKSFEGRLLGRNSTCLACHNAAWSKTGKQSGWNRTFGILGFFERSVYGTHSGHPNPKLMHAMFRSDGVLGEGYTPWGMDDSCGSFQLPGLVQRDPLLGPREKAFLAGNSYPFLPASIFFVDNKLRRGIDLLRDGVERTRSEMDVRACNVCGTCPESSSPSMFPPPLHAEVKEIITRRCISCHAASAGMLTMADNDQWHEQLWRVPSLLGNGKLRVHPGNPGQSFLMDALDYDESNRPTWAMPRTGPKLTPDEIDLVRRWIEQLPAGSGCSTCADNIQGMICPPPIATTDPLESLAYLVATNLTNKIWQEVMGFPLTIAHGYSRNNESRLLLWRMVELEFIPSNWSLKKLLTFILTSDYFNRKAPLTAGGTEIPNSGGAISPYELPMFFDPWIEQDPRHEPANTPGYDPNEHPDRHRNAMTEAIRNPTAMALLRSASTTLGWPKPQRVPSRTEFPSRDLAVSLGQYLRRSIPGFRGESLDSFLAWETNIGSCQKPEGFSQVDWLDRVIQMVSDINTASPTNLVTVGELAEVIKDWILSDGRITSLDEQQKIAAIFGQDLDTDTTQIIHLERKVRMLCGVLISTPQYKLLGMAPEGINISRPRFRVCNEGDCSYIDFCRSMARAIPELSVLCNPDSTSLSTPAPIAELVSDGIELGVPRDDILTCIQTGTCTTIAFKTMKQICVAKPKNCQKIQIIKRGKKCNGPGCLEVVELKGKAFSKRRNGKKSKADQSDRIAVLSKRGLEILRPGMSIPSEGVLAYISAGRVKIITPKMELLQAKELQQGQRYITLRQFELAIRGLRPELRGRYLKLFRENLAARLVLSPEYAQSRVPEKAAETAIRATNPYGSARAPLSHKERSQLPMKFDHRALRKRMKEAEKHREQMRKLRSKR